ncbi:MAG: hypothetical protein RRA32_11065 [bacterium]|nr:hypothetical protein [bacterium]
MSRATDKTKGALNIVSSVLVAGYIWFVLKPVIDSFGMALLIIFFYLPLMFFIFVVGVITSKNTRYSCFLVFTFFGVVPDLVGFSASRLVGACLRKSTFLPPTSRVDLHLHPCLSLGYRILLFAPLVVQKGWIMKEDAVQDKEVRETFGDRPPAHRLVRRRSFGAMA